MHGERSVLDIVSLLLTGGFAAMVLNFLAQELLGLWLVPARIALCAGFIGVGIALVLTG